MKKTLGLFKRKTSQEQHQLPEDDTGPSNPARNVAAASNNSSNTNPTVPYGNPVSHSRRIGHKSIRLTSIPESPEFLPITENTENPENVPTNIDSQPSINRDRASNEAPDLTHLTLPSTRKGNTKKAPSSDKQTQRTGFAVLSESEQQMASAFESLKRLIEAEEQYSQTLALLKALDLYLLTDKTFTISEFFPPLFPTANRIPVLDDPDRSSAAVHKAWLELLPHHLKAICKAADSSNVRNKHDLESVIDVSPERISAAESVRFVKEWSHAEQRTRMTAALIAMRDGLPDLARRWNVAVRKTKEQEVLGDLRTIVDGMKERRTARVFM
ncbi:hypothetical protein MMC26_003952 [Xylographa opegraphella]|nr:hypothetical protein [Xylographa opegraphella]